MQSGFRNGLSISVSLKERAKELLGGRLTEKEISAIDNASDTIAIPKQAHIEFSPTYGQTAAEAMRDSADLAGSARRDVEAMLKKLDEYDDSGGRKKAYKKAIGRVLRKSNNDFDEWLKNIVKKMPTGNEGNVCLSLNI